MSVAFGSLEDMTIRGFQRRRLESAEREQLAPKLTLDRSQRAVVELPDAASGSVIGAPGSGKTTTLVELVADRVLRRGYSADSIVVISPTRGTATALRDILALRVGMATNGALAVTLPALAFEIVGNALDGEQASPRLITGGEQDSDISQLLAGHVLDGTAPLWPPTLPPEVRAMRGFRTELRELYMRCSEYGITNARLREFGTAHARPEWNAAADFFREYEQVTGMQRRGQFDSAELVTRAALAVTAGLGGERVERLRLVLVDDFQEATESALVLLRALTSRGIPVLAFGDPDVAANAFRGGEPTALGRLAAELNLPRAGIHYLSTVYRQPEELRALTSAIVARIGTAAAGPQRAAGVAVPAPTELSALAPSALPAVMPPELPPVAPPALPAITPIVRIEASTVSRESAAIARILRERHLIDGIAWNDICVVVRSGAQLPQLARALSLAEVPTRTSLAGRPLREDPSARALLTVVDIGMGRSALTVDSAATLLLGCFGGLDRLALRRLRLALRAQELAAGGNRSSDELLVEAFGAPGGFASIDHDMGRRAGRMADTLQAVVEQSVAGSSIEELLWLVWERYAVVASAWQELALSTGIMAAEANRNLDGIVALFTAATRFVERQPEAPAGLFLDGVLDAEVPEDTLSPAATFDTVLVTTPSGVVGREYAVVVAAGVQDGIWPNLRLRNSLLHPQQLVDVVTGLDSTVIDARRQVLGDELRMFALTVSRARLQVVISAVASDDETPSMLFALLPPSVPVTDSSVILPLSLRGLTGRLRRELVLPRRSERERDAAAAALALLAEHNLPGAHPDSWLGLIDPTTVEPLYDDGEVIPVSPSRLDAFEKSPLDWFIDLVGGGQASNAMGIGTIIHWAMETAIDQSAAGLFSAIQSRWGELHFESPWLSEYHQHAAHELCVALAEYLTDFRQGGKRLIAAEGSFEVPLGRALLRGSIDRIEQGADGSVVIVDLKTGQPITRQSEIDDHPQLQAYQLAYAEGRLDESFDGSDSHSGGGAKLLFVKKGVRGKSYREATQAQLTVPQLDDFRARILAVAAQMASAHFVGAEQLTGFGSAVDSSAMLHRVKGVASD